MTSTYPLPAPANWWRRLSSRMQEARRMRRDLQELRSMDAHELRDIGVSRVQAAIFSTGLVDRWPG